MSSAKKRKLGEQEEKEKEKESVLSVKKDQELKTDHSKLKDEPSVSALGTHGSC